MNQYFFKPYRSFRGNISVNVDLSNYATKLELKEATGIDTSNIALKSNLASLKTEVDKTDVDKLKTVRVDLSKLRDVAKNDVVKKAVYKKLVSKVINIDTTGFVLKTKYDTDKSDLGKKISDAEKKIPDTSGFVKKTDLNAKLSEIQGKMPSSTGLVTNAASTAVKIRIPGVSSLVKKTDYDSKILDIDHDKS